MAAISLMSLLKMGSYTVKVNHICMLFVLCIGPVAFSLQVIHLLYTIYGSF